MSAIRPRPERMHRALALCACVLAPGALAGTQTLAPAHDTFIHSSFADNNNGGAPSIFTGRSGIGGIMRGLIRFDLPSALAGRVTVTSAALTMTTEPLQNSTAGAAATLSLSAVTTPWTQGTGFGSSPGTFTVGSACTTGATWNRSDCTTGAEWMGAGASAVAASSSAAAAVPLAANVAIAWTGSGVIADVQSWIDAPSGNHGWRISSSTEGAVPGQAQRFYSSQAAAAKPSLAITYDCKAGFVPSGNDCVAGGPPLTIDIDDNHLYEPLADGLLIVRYLFGLSGTALTANALGSGAMRTDPPAIKQYLDAIRPALDVDDNKQVEPLTDGLLLIRYLFALRGAALISNAIGTGALRQTAGDIETYIRSLMP